MSEGCSVGRLADLSGYEINSLNRLGMELSEKLNQRNIGILIGRHLAEEYFRNRLCIVIKLDVTPLADIGNCGERAKSANKRTILHRDQWGVLRAENGDLIDSGGADYRHEDGVLLNVVQSVKGIERVSFSAFKGFHRNENVFDRLARRFYSFATGFKVDPIVPCGEFQVTILYAAIPTNDLPCHVVERAPKVVDSIAYYEGPHGRDILSELDEDSGLSRLWVTAYGEGVRVGIHEGGKLPFQVTDVMIGPVDF